jgi:hypothetical protein
MSVLKLTGNDQLNAINLRLEPEEFLTAVKESALCPAAAEGGQDESISKAGSEDVSEEGWSATTYLLSTWLKGYKDSLKEARTQQK